MTTTEGKVSWVDIVRPTEKDLAWLKETHKIHPIIIDELRGPSARSRTESHGSYLYFIYYFPIYDTVEKVSRRGEIDFLITKKEVFTIRYEDIEVLTSLHKTLHSKHRSLEATLQLTHAILEALISFEQRQLNHIREKVEVVSTELFKEREKQREKELLEQISYIKRDISQYRLVVRPQKHLMESLFAAGKVIFGFGDDVSTYINDLYGEHLKILDQLEDYRQAVEDFESTNNQLIGIKNSQVVKTFTILAFLTFPMMLFAALFSMNTKDTPIVGHPGDFWILFGVMASCMLLMYLYFRTKDWL